MWVGGGGQAVGARVGGGQRAAAGGGRRRGASGNRAAIDWTMGACNLWGGRATVATSESGSRRAPALPLNKMPLRVHID